MTTRTVALLLSSAVSVAFSLAAFAEPAPAPAPAAAAATSTQRRKFDCGNRRYRGKAQREPGDGTRRHFGLHLQNARPDRYRNDSGHDEFHAGPGLLDLPGPRLHPRRRSGNQQSLHQSRVSPLTPTASTTPASWPLRAMRCSKIESKFCADRRAPCTAATPSPVRSIPSRSARRRIGPPRCGSKSATTRLTTSKAWYPARSATPCDSSSAAIATIKARATSAIVLNGSSEGSNLSSGNFFYWEGQFEWDITPDVEFWMRFDQLGYTDAYRVPTNTIGSYDYSAYPASALSPGAAFGAAVHGVWPEPVLTQLVHAECPGLCHESSQQQCLYILQRRWQHCQAEQDLPGHAAIDLAYALGRRLQILGRVHDVLLQLVQ